MSPRKRAFLQSLPADLRIRFQALPLRKQVRVLEKLKPKANEEEDSINEKDGYVYVLSNPEIPGLVKIGSTKRTPEERAKELSSDTGVPSSYQVTYEKAVNYPLKREMQVHKALSESRIDQDREFFRVSEEKAISVINNVVPE